MAFVMKSMIVEQSTSMSATRRRVDQAITWLAWFAWLALLLPALNWFEHGDAAASEATAAKEFSFLDYAPLFIGGIAVVASSIGLWSYYNSRRNRRVARAGHLGWLGARRVAEFYAVDLHRLFSWQHARRLIVTHDDGGSVHHVEAEGKPAAATAIIKRERAPLVAANEEQSVVETIDNVVALPLPAVSEQILHKSPDKRPTRLTYNGRVYYT